ncbi:hypothetical protein [Sphingomonas paucimobilis]|uniref:hypothetical protein n=1 Tax=Sphingomonas paucimobilis TaxID=13689 RepID=UPI0030F9F186
MIQPTPRSRDEQPPNRWERGFVWLELFGFATLFAVGTIASVWGAVDYLAGWS